MWSHHEKYLALFSHAEYHYLYENDMATFFIDTGTRKIKCTLQKYLVLENLSNKYSISTLSYIIGCKNFLTHGTESVKPSRPKNIIFKLKNNNNNNNMQNLILQNIEK